MCGLVGFYPKKDKRVRLNKLLPLWVIMEERGTHSCGIAIGTNRYIGTGVDSKARNYITANLAGLKSNSYLNSPIICHTRHATGGAHISSNAHPFKWVMKNNDTPLIFAHNGVIRNVNDISKIYKVSDYKKELLAIDSHVLGLGLFNAILNVISMEDLLTTYEGNAAFLASYGNKFLVWKGANNEIEERPMYYIETSEGWYFCSVKEALEASFLKEAISVDNNTLLVFNNHTLESTTVYERKIAPIVNVTTYKSSNNSYPLYYEKEYRDIDSFNIRNNNSLTNMNTNRYDYSDYYSQYNTVKDLAVAPITLCTSGTNIGKYTTIEKEKLRPLNGVYPLTKSANNLLYKPYIAKHGKPVNFINGVLVKFPGSTTYKQILKIFNDKKADLNNYSMALIKAQKYLDNLLLDFLPIYEKDNLKLVIYKVNNEYKIISSKPQKGNIPLLSNLISLYDSFGFKIIIESKNNQITFKTKQEW